MNLHLDKTATGFYWSGQNSTERRPNRISIVLTFGFLLLVLAPIGGLPSAVAQDAKTTFDDNVKSILRQRCASCHGPDSKKGDLDITNFTNLMQGGSSGSVIEPGDSDGSYLFNLVTHEDEPVMPPGGKIPDAEIALIKKWIDGGALENKGSKAVMSRKPAAVAMGENPMVRPEVVSSFPRISLQPVQQTARAPVAASIATSPWAPIVAVAGKNQVILYDTKTLEIIGLLPFPEGSVNVVRFSRSGSVLLAAGGRAGSSGVAVLWDVATGQRISKVGDELDAVLAADISPDHSMVAVGGSDKLVKIYSTSTGEQLHVIAKHTDWITSLAFSTDGVLLATGDRNGGLHVWESMTARAYLTLKGHSATVASIAWRGDSNVVASASKDKSIRLWELNNGRQIKTWDAHAGGVSSIAFTRDARIVSTGADKVTRIFAQDGKQQLAFPAMNDVATAVAWCDETTRAIAGDFNGEIRVWKSDDGTQLGTLSANPPTLENRLTAAKAAYAERSTLLPPLTAKAKSTNDAAQVIHVQLAAATVLKTQAQTAFTDVQNALAETNEKASQLQTQIAATSSTLTELQEVKPLLDQSLASMSAASEKLPADEALTTQVAQLNQRVVAMEAKIVKSKESMAALQASLTELTSQVKATDQRVKAATDNLKMASDKVTALTEQLAPLSQARDAASSELQTATERAEQAQQQVTRWQGEIEFVALLEALAKRQQEAEQVVQQKQKSLDEVNEALKAAQANSAAAQATVDQARHSVEAIQAEIESARQIPD